jgi:hypothetical protein
MSPEGAVYAVEHYLEELQAQAKVAFHFFYGHTMEALQGFLRLPEEVQNQIQGLMWEETQGELVDIGDPLQGPFVASAILHQMERRMGY